MSIHRIILGLVVVAVSVQAHAASETFMFQGSLTSVQDDPSNILSANFSVGDSVSGIYKIDTTIPDALPADPSYGRYMGAVKFKVAIGGSSWYGIAEHRAFNDRGAPVEDIYSIINETGFSGSTFGSLLPETFFIQLFDTTASVFSSDALVSTAPVLSDFNQQINGLRLGNTKNKLDYGVLRFNVTSITAVPEPMAIFQGLIGLAAVTFGIYRRRLA